MQLLVLVLNKVDCLSDILAEMMAAGVRGATVLDSQGMIQLLGEASVEPPPIFGSLRKFFNPDGQMSKTLFVALREEQVAQVSGIVNRVTGGLGRPNTGVLFTLPLLHVEGMAGA